MQSEQIFHIEKLVLISKINQNLEKKPATSK